MADIKQQAPKIIVICSDGTGNTAFKGRGTNVFKLFEAVDVHRKDVKQLAIYDDGVGTQSIKWLRMISGAIGLGLSRNVRKLYTELAHVYNPGDKIFLFGFSRGAFTVRTLAGMIHACGILDHAVTDDGELRSRARKAYRAYRCSYKAWLERLLCLVGQFLPYYSDCCRTKSTAVIREKYALKNNDFLPDKDGRKVIPPIEFIGVWDTVAAMGFPVAWMSDVINLVFYRFKFGNTELCGNIKRACHALSIDDERQTFHPTLWDEGDKDRQDRIEQVWFSGVHANVGGGYPKQGMSLMALDWMMDKAGEYDLKFIEPDRTSYHEHRNITDKLYDSRAGFAAFYRYGPRNIGKLCKEYHVDPMVHISTFYRIAQGTEGYSPGNLPANLQVVNASGTDTRHGALHSIVHADMDAQQCLLDGVEKLVTVRKIAQIVFVVSLLLLLGAWLCNMTRTDAGFWSSLWSAVTSLFSFAGIWAFLKFAWTHYQLMLLIPVAAWAVGLWAKGRMHRHYSAFWFKHLTAMRRLFRLTNE